MHKTVALETIRTILHEQLGLALAREHAAQAALTRLDDAERYGYLADIMARTALGELRLMLRTEENEAHNAGARLRSMLDGLEALLEPREPTEQAG